MKYPVYKYAKQKSKEALEWNKKQPRSKRVGTLIGRVRARQLIRDDFVTEATAKRIVAFYDRFKGCGTERCEQALNLWGGRKYGKRLKEMMNK
tara:strand:- start:5339 stop:5617 length:279 start_codon:yes stop_codon:yes gene_type:complete